MTHTVAQWQTQAAVKDRLSRPLRDLRISVIDRCNYRCPYCMPAELFGENHKFLPRGHWLTPGEIKRVASVFLQLGVKKLRLTGGEPLLRRDIVEIVAGLAELHGAEDSAITTNGSRLAEHAAALKASGLEAHHREPRQPRRSGVQGDERRPRRARASCSQASRRRAPPGSR